MPGGPALARTDTHMDFERARFNMIEQQIRPWDVLDPDVLDLLSAVRREDFVPASWRNMAFTDMEIPLEVDGRNTGECMLAPKVEARLLQAARVQRHENVLEIGAGSGFMAALLAHRARRVSSAEINPELAAMASANLKKSHVANATVELRDGQEVASQASWDVIVLSGSVPFVPPSLLDRLEVGGRLVGIVGELPVMEAQVITRVGEREFDTKTDFDAVAPLLVGFPARERFRF